MSRPGNGTPVAVIVPSEQKRKRKAAEQLVKPQLPLPMRLCIYWRMRRSEPLVACDFDKCLLKGAPQDFLLTGIFGG